MQHLWHNNHKKHVYSVIFDWTAHGRCVSSAWRQKALKMCFGVTPMLMALPHGVTLFTNVTLLGQEVALLLWLELVAFIFVWYPSMFCMLGILDVDATWRGLQSKYWLAREDFGEDAIKRSAFSRRPKGWNFTASNMVSRSLCPSYRRLRWLGKLIATRKWDAKGMTRSWFYVGWLVKCSCKTVVMIAWPRSCGLQMLSSTWSQSVAILRPLWKSKTGSHWVPSWSIHMCL